MRSDLLSGEIPYKLQLVGLEMEENLLLILPRFLADIFK
ncbi:MAG: hypothetical protein CM1200mP30_19470 [Pseudomonadota bacterium]|nr:MAG: hypothetical protein CM1200mP30_19470 [Pseudomonadota bacterium]